MKTSVLDSCFARYFFLSAILAGSLPIVAAETLISAGSVWKYLDTGVDAATAWRERTFDDGTWASGAAELGYGDGDEATLVSSGPDPANKYVTTYFRKRFSLADPSTVSNLVLRVRRDDGVVVYLNGTEILRDNLPAGPISHNTLAVSVAADDGRDFLTSAVPPGLLVTGRNVIAAEVHQANVNSTDLSFDLELTGQGTVNTNFPDLSFRLAFYDPYATWPKNVFLRDYTLEGPMDGGRLLPAMRVVADGGTHYYYGTDGPGYRQATRLDSQTGQAENILFTPISEDLGWEMGTAFDAARQRVLLVTLGGEGFLYALQENQNEWTRIASMNNFDVDCLEYHTAADSLFAVKINHADNGPFALYEFSADGAFRREIPLPGFPFDIAPARHRSELVSVGDYLVLLLEPDSQNIRGLSSRESRIYLIDPRTGQNWLTYQRLLFDPPLVHLNQPATTYGPTNVVLTADSSGDEAGIKQVEFLNGTDLIGYVTATNPAQNRFSFDWSNVAVGSYALTARATDTRGSTAMSAPVSFTVLPRDYDGDGVPDDRDQCPNTLPGFAVDTNGCPLVVGNCPPPLQWQASFAKNDFNLLSAARQLPDGGYLLAGVTANFSGPASSRADGWVVRVNVTGQRLWERTYGGDQDDYFTCVELLPDGGFLLGGASDSGISGSKTSPNLGGEDIWVVRIDADGNMLWDKTLGGPDDDEIGDVKRAPDGTLVVCGEIDDGERAYVARINTGGENLWEKAIDISEDETFTQVVPLVDGGLLLGGSVSGEEDYSDYWLVRLDAGGMVLWQRFYGGDGTELLHAIAAAGDGGFLLGGLSNSDTSPGKSSPHFGETDVWLVRVDADGHKLWERAYGGSGDEHSRVSLVATTDGGFLAGVTSRSGASGNKISSPRGEADYWTLRLDANGQKLWEESYGGTGDDFLAVVLQTSDGGYLVAGSSESPISGNKTSPLESNSDLGAVRDGWLVKLGPGSGCITDSDGDGVPDAQDLCPNTPPGSIVNTHGCGLAQLCPCDGSWRNHADYVRCVIEDAWQFYRHGLLTAAQRHDAIRIAARSHCGQDEGVHVFLQPETRAEIQQDGLRLILCGNLTGDCVLECTTDLAHWIPIQTNTAPALEMEIADPTAGQAQTRFYRVRLQP